MRNSILRNSILRFCAKIAFQYPKSILISFNIVALISGLFAFYNLKISTEYDSLRSDKLPYANAYNQFKKSFNDNNFILLVIDAKDNKNISKEVAKTLASKIKKLNTIKHVFYKVDIELFKNNSLLFLSNENFNLLQNIINRTKQEMTKIGEFNNINSFFTYFRNILTQKNTTEVDTILLHYFVREFELVFEKGVEHSVIKDFLSKKLEDFSDEGYFFTDNKEFIFVLVLPEKTEGTIDLIEEPLGDIRGIVSSVKKQFNNINIGITGQPVIQSDEMSITSKDMSYAAFISIFIVAFLFIVSLKNIARPLLSVYTLIIAIAITFGITSLYPGHLTILSIVFTVMMIGIGIDFSIHIISRYHEELARGNTLYLALEKTLLKAGRSSLSGIITSSIAFYMALLVDFKGLQELGFIAGTGILLVLFTTMLLLPAVLVLYDTKRQKLNLTSFIQIHALNKVRLYPKTIIISILFITIVGISVLLFKGLPKFNNNLMDLQAHGIESVFYELKLISSSKGSGWFSTMFVVPDLQANDDIISSLSSKDSIGKISSVRDYIPKNQNESMRKIALLKDDINSLIKGVSYKPNSLSIKALINNLEDIKKLIETKDTQSDTKSNTTYVLGIRENLLQSISQLLERLKQKEASKTVLEFQDRVFNDVKEGYSIFKSLLNPTIIKIDDMSEVIKFRHVGKDNKLVVYASPKENIWEWDNLEQYIKDVKIVSSDVLGTALNFYEDMKRMKAGFLNISIYVLVFVFIILVIDFRSLYLAFIALIPLFLGFVWLVSIMSFYDIAFNIGNTFSIPLLIGISITYGIHIVHRFIEDKSSLFIIKSTGTAVILTALTTIVGFGSLLIATHRGTFSLGLVMVIGISSALVTSIVFLPALLEVIISKDRKEKFFDKE